MLITALLTALALAAAPSHPSEPDGVVTTAPATTALLDGATAPAAPPVGQAPQSMTPHGLNTDQQIAQWLAARASEPAAHDESPVWRDDRQPHGEVSVGFGTGGYRDYGAAVSLPIGESGRLDISVRQVENGYSHAYGYGGGYGYDPYFADGGYAFPGRASPGTALDYERRLARPDGPPNRRPGLRPQPAAEE